MRKILTFILLMSLSYSVYAATTIETGNGSSADDLCPTADIWGSKLITDICWSCMLPFKMFGIGNPEGEPDNSSSSILCSCDDNLGIPKFGFHAGYWNPLKLVEVVRQPYCSPVLGGTAFGFDPTMFGGYGPNIRNDIKGQGMYHVNYWSFPLMQILEMIVQANCQVDNYTQFDLINTTTLDPVANDSELSLFMVPEVVVFSNPLAIAACGVDCATTTATGKSSDAFFWCAGCWGTMYPLTTFNHAETSPPRGSSLTAAKYIALQHRRGFARKTYGDSAMCGAEIYPFFPKQQYRWSLFFPIPEASDDEVPSLSQSTTAPTVNSTPTEATQHDPMLMSSTLNDRCCHATGESTFKWGEWRNIPVVGEDFVYLLWSYTDCCFN